MLGTIISWISRDLGDLISYCNPLDWTMLTELRRIWSWKYQRWPNAKMLRNCRVTRMRTPKLRYVHSFVVILVRTFVDIVSNWSRNCAISKVNRYTGDSVCRVPPIIIQMPLREMLISWKYCTPICSYPPTNTSAPRITYYRIRNNFRNPPCLCRSNTHN